MLTFPIFETTYFDVYLENGIAFLMYDVDSDSIYGLVLDCENITYSESDLYNFGLNNDFSSNSYAESNSGGYHSVVGDR